LLLTHALARPGLRLSAQEFVRHTEEVVGKAQRRSTLDKVGPQCMMDTSRCMVHHLSYSLQLNLTGLGILGIRQDC